MPICPLSRKLLLDAKNIKKQQKLEEEQKIKEIDKKFQDAKEGTLKLEEPENNQEFVEVEKVVIVENKVKKPSVVREKAVTLEDRQVSLEKTEDIDAKFFAAQKEREKVNDFLKDHEEVLGGKSKDLKGKEKNQLLKVEIIEEDNVIQKFFKKIGLKF